MPEIPRIVELLSRVYINMDKQYVLPDNMEFEKLYDAVAKNNPIGDKDPLIQKRSNGDEEHVCIAHTRRYIVKRCNSYVYGMHQRLATENLVNFISIRQLKKLQGLFEGKKRSVPAYAVVVLYIIYTLLPDNEKSQNLCLNYLRALYTPVREYYLHNLNDPLALFMDECFNLVIGTISEGRRDLQVDEFPAIPRRHPVESND